jgi:hypothetical protein
VAMTATKPHQPQVSERPQQTFERPAEPFRREIKLHCYRIGRNLPPLMFRTSGRTAIKQHPPLADFRNRTERTAFGLRRPEG